ncbi:MAG: hypothetical protein P1P87_00285 [Trueperaceae bacterium]|nr:hypothetical protein [Trueperaceae bacterium]
MARSDRFAYLLIGLGAIALLARLSDGAGWLWLGLVAAALLAAYVQQRTYGFLVVGSILAGTSVGLLLQAAFPRCDGVFLISLGVGLIAIDRVEARAPRWPWGLGLTLVIIGIVSGLMSSGLLASTWFALLLIVAGALLLWRRREAAAFPPAVRDGPGPQTPAAPPVVARSEAPAAPAAPEAPAAPTATDASNADAPADEDEPPRDGA